MSLRRADLHPTTRRAPWTRDQHVADWAHAQDEAPRAAVELAAVAVHNAARPVTSGMPDRDLCALAERRADLMADRLAALADTRTPEAMRAWLSDQVEALNARPLPPFGGTLTEAEQLAGLLARVVCRLWWRRQLRRAVVTLREVEAMQRGEVCARRRQVYVTDDTVRRRAERVAANAAMLEATEIEDAAGEVITLAQAVAASTANKAIRRGELMTRIRGCEEWASAAGMVGIFTTNTAPSRFHAQTMHKGSNPNHDGSTPRDAQGWLRDTWAKCRAALARADVGVFGFRVAEPHHDGCPHWHMLLWCEPAHLEALRATMRAYWLKDAGDEPGASEHRFKSEAIDPAKGGAIAYIAKYIAKNIDDVGALEAEGHSDQHAGEQAELFGATARRVDAWAAAWGIRQFQAIGQPPVTVWRELRRVTPEAVAGGSDAIKAAHAAVHRHGARRACWRAYMAAQGGAMVGRDYRVRIVADASQKLGRYGLAEVARPFGVEDVRRLGEVVLSDRREWKGRGQWTDADRAPRVRLLHFDRAPTAPAGVVSPRTRFNNCTDGAARGGFRAVVRDLLDRNRLDYHPAGGPPSHERATL